MTQKCQAGHIEMSILFPSLTSQTEKQSQLVKTKQQKFLEYTCSICIQYFSYLVFWFNSNATSNTRKTGNKNIFFKIRTHSFEEIQALNSKANASRRKPKYKPHNTYRVREPPRWSCTRWGLFWGRGLCGSPLFWAPVKSQSRCIPQ